MAIPRGDAADPRGGSADAHSDDDDDASDTSEPSRFVTTALVSSSVVTHAVRGRFRAPDEMAVVLGKRDQLLLLAPDEERGGALGLERQQSARGTLVALKVARGGYGESDADVRERDDTARVSDSFRENVDALVAISDSGELSLLRYDKETGRFARFRSARLGPPGMRRVAPGVASRAAPLAEFDHIAVDPASGAIAVSCEDRACVFQGLLRNGPKEPCDRGAPLRREGGVILGTAFAEVLGTPSERDASSTRADRGKIRRFVALGVLTRDREDVMCIARARLGAESDAGDREDDGNAAEGAEDGTPLHAGDAAERDSAHPRETREARRLREIPEFGLGRDRPLPLRPPGVRLPMEIASDTEAVPVAPGARPETDRGASASAAPTRLDVFYGATGPAAFGETASSDDAKPSEPSGLFSSPPAYSVVFDDDARAVLGEKACLVDPRDDRCEAGLESSATPRVRFLVLGEFGAVQVSAPSGNGSTNAARGEAHVVARAAPGETWSPQCHAWRAPSSPAERWSVVVACHSRRDGKTREGDALPEVRAALAVDRETGAATPFGETLGVSLGADDATDVNDAPTRRACGARLGGERRDDPKLRRSADPTAMLLLENGESAIAFVADGSAVARATGTEGNASPTSRGPVHRRYARDAVSLVLSHAVRSSSRRGECVDRAPPLAPVDGFAPAGENPRADESFLLTAGGAPARVTFGVAAAVSTVSPPGFGGVTSMWAPDDTTLVLGFADATRVFQVVKEASASASASASFVEAETGLGFKLDEPTTACGAFRVNAPGSHLGFASGGMAQVTTARSRLCARGELVSEWNPGGGDGVIGAAAVSPHGRAAVSLPKLGAVKILAPMTVRDSHAAETLRLLPVSIVRFANEPSCLAIPDPETGASFLSAVESDAITAGNVGADAVTALFAGTYAREVVVVAARETRGSVAAGAFASEVFRSELELPPGTTETAPAAMRVAFGDAERAPTLLVATRGGDLLVITAVGGRTTQARRARAHRKRRLATTSPTLGPRAAEATPRRPPRLVGFARSAVAPPYRDPPVIRIGADSAERTAEASKRSPLGDMLVPPKSKPDARASPQEPTNRSGDSGSADVDFGGTRRAPDADSQTPNASSAERDRMRVVCARRLGNAPLAFLEPLADGGAGAPVIAAGASGAWLVRGVDGAQRVSVARVDAPPVRAVVAFGFGASSTRRPAFVLAAVGDRLKAVDLDVDQADAAHRDCDPAAGAPRAARRGAGSPLVRFVCRDPETGAAVAATEPGAGIAVDVAAWCLGRAAEGDFEGAEDADVAVRDDRRETDRRDGGDARLERPSADRSGAIADETAEPLHEEIPDATVSFDVPHGVQEGFRAVAMACCRAEDGSSVIVVGARGVARARARRAFDGADDADPAVEGRVSFLRLVPSGDGARSLDHEPDAVPHAMEVDFGSGERYPVPAARARRAGRGARRFALAATAAFPNAVTCVSAAGPGLVLVGTTAGAHVLRVETRPAARARHREKGDRRDGTAAETAGATEAEDRRGVSRTLRVWLAARMATRRPVLALDAGEPEVPKRSGAAAESTTRNASDGDVPFTPRGAAGGNFDTAGAGAGSPRGDPAALRAASERATAEAMLFPGAREPERRCVVPVAVSVARDGVSVCAYIAGGGFFETDRRRRLAPRAADPETRDAVSVALRRRGEVVGADAQGRVFVLRRARARAPGSNLRLAARFNLKGAKPVAVLVRGSDSVSTEETREDARRARRGEKKTQRAVAADRATLFDAARARRAAGPPFAVATEEGGVFRVSEVSTRDWEVLARAQRALDAHPATAPPLGFGIAKTTGSGDDDVFADRRLTSDGVSKRCGALDAARRASAPSPPAVLDGTLLRELLVLPEKTQREVLALDAAGGGAATAEATLETARRVLETDFFS